MLFELFGRLPDEQRFVEESENRITTFNSEAIFGNFAIKSPIWLAESMFNFPSEMNSNKRI